MLRLENIYVINSTFQYSLMSHRTKLLFLEEKEIMPMLRSVKNENQYSDHDYDFFMGDDNQVLGIEANNVEEEEALTNGNDNDQHIESESHPRGRRNVKKPDFLKMDGNNAKRSVRSRSRSKSRPPGPKKPKTKDVEVEPVKYEVDYINGKRPDRKKKGKFEYKVYWKGYPADESTWEPEQGLQMCRDAILAYERSQGYPVPEEGEEEEEEEEEEDWQKKDEKKLSIGKGGKAAGTSKTLAKVLMKPKKLLATMRARPTPKQERRMPKRGASHRRNTISASKQSSPDRYSSHSQSPASSSSNGVDLACTSQQKKSLPEMGKRPPAKSKEMNGHHSATNTKLKLEHIDAITHVRESNIESIGPIAEVSLKNGGIKQVPISIIKAIAPNLLFECYERMLGFDVDQSEN